MKRLSKKEKIEYADKMDIIETRVEEIVEEKRPKQNKKAIVPENVDWDKLFLHVVDEHNTFMQSCNTSAYWEKQNLTLAMSRDQNGLSLTTNIPEAIDRIKEIYGRDPNKVCLQTLTKYKDGENWAVKIKDGTEAFCYNDEIEIAEEPEFNQTRKIWFDTDDALEASYATERLSQSLSKTKTEYNTLTIQTTDERVKRRIVAYAEEYPENVTFETLCMGTAHKPLQVGWIVKINTVDFLTRRV